MINLYKQLRAALRLILFATVMIVFFLHGSIIYFLNEDPIKRRKKLIHNGHLYCKRMLQAFNVELICKNPIAADESSLLVGNHVGFIDILCLQSIQPAVFVTSLEMKNSPGLGQISEVGGCAYVDRRNRMKIHDELKGLVDVLKQGFRIVLYAESVASDGEQVLPFKKTLMMAAGLAGVPIRPFVFNFRTINNEPVQFKYRDSVCWYGDQTFFPAIWRSLQLDTVTCEIEYLPLVNVHPEDDRTEVANRVHKMVSEKFVPFVNEAKFQKTYSNENLFLQDN